MTVLPAGLVRLIRFPSPVYPGWTADKDWSTFKAWLGSSGTTGESIGSKSIEDEEE